ncbi:DNA repair protein XRCC3-like isoform X1 [Macrobrachium nipponense]|uniref:DNA repair protein XRCC3-like isoform X1 n=1 Tax=Macrobrachium nipponense TaxID=159736 RepID=UPI0030C890A9
METSRKRDPSDDLGLLFINPRIKDGLRRAGFCSARSIFSTSHFELRERAGLSNADIESLISALSQAILPESRTCWEVLEEEEGSTLTIPTGCSQLDRNLGGGIPVKGITEIYGESGSGKTQIALQLALNAQLSKNLGGFGKGVVYICTESQFPINRLHQMIDFMQKRYPQGPKSYKDCLFIHHIPDLENLLYCIQYQLPTLMSKHEIGMVILDTVAAVFRSDEGPEINRLVMFKKLRHKLHELGSLKKTPVIVLNQVTTSFGNKQMSLYGLNNQVMPSLGLSWANLVTTRVMLSRTESFITSYAASHAVEGSTFSKDVAGEGEDAKSGQSRSVQYRIRTLHIIFCPWLARKSVEFLVTHNGIEDVPSGNFIM